jgi:hypothetical protein
VSSQQDQAGGGPEGLPRGQQGAPSLSAQLESAGQHSDPVHAESAQVQAPGGDELRALHTASACADSAHACADATQQCAAYACSDSTLHCTRVTGNVSGYARSLNECSRNVVHQHGPIQLRGVGGGDWRFGWRLLVSQHSGQQGASGGLTRCHTHRHVDTKHTQTNRHTQTQTDTDT